MTKFDIGDVVDVKLVDKVHRGIVIKLTRNEFFGELRVETGEWSEYVYEHECTLVSDEDVFGVPRVGTWWDRKGLTYKTSPVEILKFSDGFVHYRQAHFTNAKSLGKFLEQFEPAKFKS